MKNIEYAIYDLDLDEEEIKVKILNAQSLNINCISIPYFYTKLVKSLVKDTQIIVSNSIDYPHGLSDTKSRNSAVKNAIVNGAQKIEIVIQNNLLSNRKYDKIRNDIKSNIDICAINNIPITYYLEYRIFTHHSLIKACDIIQEFGLKSVYPSTGNMIDNIDDNIIASILLKEKTGISTIFTGNIWNKNHIEKLNKYKIDQIRTNTLNGVRLFNEFST
jgi:deoxyribose-phosphate aldolase